MSNLPTIKITFFLEGDEFSEEKVSTKLGMTPDEFRTKDDWPDAIKNAIDLPSHLRPRTGWSIDVKRESCCAVSDQFEKMMDLFKGKESMINELCEELNLSTAFVVVIEMEGGDRPEMVLTKEIVNFISSINAEIGFDLYIDDAEI